MKANNKTDKNISREEYLYHNTEILLSKYRDVVWSIEVSAIQAQISFELEMDCKLEEFLEMSYSAGVDLTGTQIQEQIRTLERNKKMLKIIDASIQVLREKEADGDVIYWILYYTYLSKRPCKNIDEIIDRVSEKTEIISRRTYFKKRKKAIGVLGGILWGFTTKECLPIINIFV